MPATLGIVKKVSATGDAVLFFWDFQTLVLPVLVHLKITPDCLKVAPTGEQASPFLMVAACPLIWPATTRVIEMERAVKTLWEVIINCFFISQENLIQMSFIDTSWVKDVPIVLFWEIFLKVETGFLQNILLLQSLL